MLPENYNTATHLETIVRIVGNLSNYVRYDFTTDIAKLFGSWTNYV